MSEIINSTYIPGDHYFSKTQTAKILGINNTTVQYHIKQGHIDTILMPGLGHHLKKRDVLNLKKQLDDGTIKPGRPSIYSKVISNE